MRDLPDFAKGRILVVGDVMLDRFWHGATTRVSPEAPVPVVKVDDVDDRPGGAANVAANLAALGVQVTLAGLVGDDGYAKRLRATVESGCRVVSDALRWQHDREAAGAQSQPAAHSNGFRAAS